MTNNIQELLFEAFECGVDYGQLLMEEERQNEEVFDGFMGCVHDKKYNIPMGITQRRQLHSEKWFEVKRKSKSRFFEILNKINNRRKNGFGCKNEVERLTN